MSLRCSATKLAAAIGCDRLAERHAANCTHCREELEAAGQIDSLLSQPTASSPTGRAPVKLIAAVRATPTSEPAPKDVLASAAWACAALAVGLLILVAAAARETPARPTVVTAPPTVKPLALPTASAGQAETTAELALVDFESEFALLAADFRRGAGRE